MKTKTSEQKFVQFQCDLEKTKKRRFWSLISFIVIIFLFSIVHFAVYRDIVLTLCGACVSLFIMSFVFAYWIDQMNMTTIEKALKESLVTENKKTIPDRKENVEDLEIKYQVCIKCSERNFWQYFKSRKWLKPINM